MNENHARKQGGAYIASGSLLLMTLAGCVTPGVEETVLPARIDYACADNRVLAVARAPDGGSAAVWVEGKERVLRRADSAAQEKYSDGRLSLYLDGERAMLENDGTVLFGPCMSPVPLPSAPRYRY